MGVFIAVCRSVFRLHCFTPLTSPPPPSSERLVTDNDYFPYFELKMDLTAAIRLKIDRLRTAKTARFNALSSAIEREVALLTHQSADLFSKLEDALEADVLGDNIVDEELEMDKDLGKDDDDEEEEDDVDESHREPKVTDREVYDVIGEERGMHNDPQYDYYYGRSREKSRTPSIAAKPPPAKQEDSTTVTSLVVKKVPDTSSVSDLRSRAQATQTILAEKHTSLVQLRQKHDHAMKRLDKLQSDLEKVSQQWEAGERARLQSESVTVLGKRKRDAEDAEPHRPEGWKKWGRKGVEWGLAFGFGLVGGTVAMSQFRQ